MWCIEKCVHEEFFHNREFYYTAKINEGVKGKNYTREDCIHNKIYFNVDAHLKVITHDRGAFPWNNNDMIFKLLPREEVLKSCYRVDRVFKTLKILCLSSMGNVGELNSNYVTFGSTPNMDGIDSSFQMPSFSEDEKINLKNFTRLLNIMQHKSNLYFDVDPRQRIEDVSMHSTWDAVQDDETKESFIFDKKKLSRFHAGEDGGE